MPRCRYSTDGATVANSRSIITTASDSSHRDTSRQSWYARPWQTTRHAARQVAASVRGTCVYLAISTFYIGFRLHRNGGQWCWPKTGVPFLGNGIALGHTRGTLWPFLGVPETRPLAMRSARYVIARRPAGIPGVAPGYGEPTAAPPKTCRNPAEIRASPARHQGIGVTCGHESMQF